MIIGKFFYASTRFPAAIAVEMQRQSNHAMGVLHIPPAILRLAKTTDFAEARDGETLMLPLALGLGLILAMQTKTQLYLTGDASVWDEDWGQLLRFEDYADVLQSPSKPLLDHHGAHHFPLNHYARLQ